MNIVFVIESLSRKGGAENALIQLAIEMQSREQNVQIVYLWGPNDFQEILNLHCIEVHCLKLPHRWSILRGFIGMHKILSNSDAKIINALNFFPMLYVALSKLSIYGKKRVVTYHNMGYQANPAQGLFQHLKKTIEIVANRFFMNGHIGVSQAVSSSYQKHLGLQTFHTIPNIISMTEINKILNKDFTLPRSTVDYEIIMVGRLISEKGYQYMFEAIELLKKENLSFQLTIFGEGILRNAIDRDISSRNLQQHVNILSSAPHSELFSFVERADLFVMSSVSEGFPMAPAEAMVLGTPVVATTAGGIPELIEDGVSGILVPPREGRMLFKAIKDVLLNEELKVSLVQSAKKRIKENFDNQVIYQKYENYFNSLLEDANE